MSKQLHVLQVFEHKKIQSISIETKKGITQENDGYWIYLKPGWTADQHGPHHIHEYTVAECLKKFRHVEKCLCADCMEEGRE